MNRKSKGLAEAARFELQARLIRKRERCTAQYNALPAVGWEWRTILELCHLSTCRVSVRQAPSIRSTCQASRVSVAKVTRASSACCPPLVAVAMILAVILPPVARQTVMRQAYCELGRPTEREASKSTWEDGAEIRGDSDSTRRAETSMWRSDVW